MVTPMKKPTPEQVLVANLGVGVALVFWRLGKFKFF
jgi:hypothetical protein